MSESGQQTTGGGKNRSDEKTEKTSDGTFRSTFKFSFGRKRTTESSKTQVAHQGHSAVSKDQSLQLSEVSSIVPEDKGPDVLPKPEKSSVENLQVESQCTDSDNIIEKTEPSTVQQQEQEDENNVKDQLQLAVTLETEESSVQNIQGESQVLQHLGTESDNTTENIEPPTVQEQENGDNKDQLKQAATLHDQSALLETEESPVENKLDENQALQPLGTESDNTTENAEPSTVQQQEQEEEDNNKDQLQQAATPESQDVHNTEESPVENTQTEELRGQVLQSDILESFDPYVAQEDEDKKENETQRQRSPEYQDVLSDPEESSVPQNKQSNEHSEDILDILESFDPLDNTGQSTVKSEDEHQEHEQPQRIRSTTPEFQDALFDPEDPEEHNEGRGLQSPDVLEFFDPLDTTGKQYNKKDDKPQVSTTFVEPPTDPEESSTETKEHSEHQVLQSSDLLESFDPLVNTGKSTIQQECKNDDETQKQASTDFQDSPLDPTEESSFPSQHGHGSEHEKNDQTQNAVDPDQDEDYDESLLWFDTPEYLDILQQEPGGSRLEQKQAEEENEVKFMQWSDSVEHQDVPQDSKQSLEQFEEDRTQQSLSVKNQTEDQDNSQALQWSDSLEYYEGNEERIKDHEEDSSDQMKTQEPANDMNQGILLSDVPEGKKAQTIQEESMVKEDQADQNETSPVQLLSGGPEDRDVTTIGIVEPSAVQQHQDEGQELGQVLLLSESPEDKEVSSTQQQPVVQTYEKEKSNISDSSELQASSTLPTKSQQHKDKEPDTREALPSSERLENQDVLHLQKQPLTQQDQNDEEKSNVLSESDSSESDSEFQDVPLQDEEDESSQSDSSTDQDVSPTLTIQQEHGKEPDTSQALPLPEGTEEQEAVALPKQPVVQQDQIYEKKTSDVLFEADSSEFQDVVQLQKDEDEGSQSDSSRDEEASSTPYITSIQQHEGKEPDTSQALPLPESTEEQEAVPLPKQPVVQQVYEKKKSDVLFEADSSEFQDVQLQKPEKEEDEASQSDSSRDEKVSSTPDSTSIQQQECKEQDSSHALPLGESQEVQDFPPYPKQATVRQDQTDEKEKGDVSSESDSSDFQDVPLHDEENESSQSDSSTDQEDSTTLPKQSQQHQDKEHDTRKKQPMSGSQEDSSLLEQPILSPYEAQEDMTNQGALLSEDTDIRDASPLAKQQDQELPLSEGSTDQDDETPLQYFNTSESESSEFQDVPSEDEDVSIFPEMAQVRYQAKEHKSQVLPLSEGLENKNSTVQQQTDEQEKTKAPSDSDSLELEDVPSPVGKFPAQRYEDKGLDKSRASVESEITEDEGVLLSPLTPPQEKRSLVLEGSDDTKRKKGSASPKPDDLENRLLEANATIATLLGELDQVRGEIKERANIGTDVVEESGHRQKADTPQTTVRSVEIGVNTEEDKTQADLSQSGGVDDNVSTKQGQANTTMGDSGAKKQQKTVSRGIQTDFADNADIAAMPPEKREDSEAGKGEKPSGKTESKSKTRSAIVEMMKDDRELKAKFNIAENLKKALAAKSKGAQQGKAEATPSEEVVKVEEIRHLDRITFGGKGSELGKFNRPRGVAVSSKNEIFVADRDNRRIQVHNMKGETLREIPTTVPGQETLTMRPDDIAIDGNDLMWIVGSDWSTEFVIPYTMEGEPLGKFDLPDTVRFRGITVNPRNDHVIVTLTDKTFGTRGEVRVFRPDGWQLRRVGLNQGMVAPMFVSLDKDDNILVSDYGTHSVYAFDQDGTFLFKFGGYGSGVGQLKDPRGICVDGAGNIIVADFGNKRLEMFSNQGKFLRHVTDSTGRPDGIAVGPDGQLVVTEWNHTASIIPSY
ncbi:PREDICTED: LOW QUALITY PROTEIN: putative mediator of RNA polymerase II transcription subunit 26 [Branchiostoma belcheri]|uniref:LOW QUALITY PROTEIN: putative mediator of RNA polymerase II transcription subunit 26 n=1 Tax=Branchiostoma belcheri TaxID=7741 RepID=A0A6P4ZYF7_BRABE|nr:PREDICTED: LOW QUALITY PROTEIN: putative mediator of RNA polymerase II transcription subunit 26 [Branchiostoma belcheri]